MKELISAVIFVAGICGGTMALKSIHHTVRKAALEKASQGLPSLANMNKMLRRKE